MTESSPSTAECWEMIREACELVADEWSNARGNFLTNVDNFVQDIEGALAKQAVPVVGAIRAQYAALIEHGRQLLDPLIRELARSHGLTTAGGAASLAALYEQLEADSDTVLHRDFTRGSASAGGSNIGDGTFVACTTDRYAHDIEDGIATTTTFTCVRDQSTGVLPGNEVFAATFAGTAPADAISVPTGGLAPIAITSILRGGGILQNPSFDANPANADTTGEGSKFLGWRASGSNANLIYSDAEYFHVSPGRALVTNGSAHGRSARFSGDDTIYQELVGLRDDVPYCCAVRYKFSGASSGTLTVTAGSVSDTATHADTNWHTLVLFGTDENAWYRNFQSASGPTNLTIDLSSHSSNDCYIDDVVFAEMRYVNGRWVLPLSGATDWRNQNDANGDKVSFTDTLPSSIGTGVIQTILNKLFPRSGAWPGYLPHAASAANTIAEP